MHRRQLREIIHDVDILCAITPIVQKHQLTVDATTELLTQLSIPRARHLAALVRRSV
jgi:hypothetical protein